jgi:hypothetical protein
MKERIHWGTKRVFKGTGTQFPLMKFYSHLLIDLHIFNIMLPTLK